MLFASTNSPVALLSKDKIELRLDLFPSMDLELIKQSIQSSPGQIMLTLRSEKEGGRCGASLQERQALILKLLTFKPAFLDLECNLDTEFIRHILATYKDTSFILSCHSTQGPFDRETCLRTYQKMKAFSASYYKIATHVTSATQALEALCLSKEFDDLSVICMGEKGRFARVLHCTFRNKLNYASLSDDHKTAPGQLTLKEMKDIYRCHTLSPSTKLFGLIGDPVEQSQGHLYHNGVFARNECDAVYVKMAVEDKELPKFIPLAQTLGFAGLSVTMPLKEKVFSYAEPLETKVSDIEALNTLIFTGKKMLGQNTDGKGALDALEEVESVKGKTLVILGAGGSAKAVAYEAKERGAQLWILSRNPERAKALAKKIGGRYGSLENLPQSYDILINCSAGPGTIDLSGVNAKTTVMDIVYTPKETLFLQQAKERGAQKLVYGQEMFMRQAAAQTKLWIG